MRGFAFAFAVLAATSLVAWRWRPEEPKGRRPLVWVTDDSPARRQQVALFNRLNPDLDLRLDPENGGVEKVIVQAQGGVGPDLFDSRAASDLATYVQAGIAWDVTDALARRGIDPRHDAWPAVRPMGILDGRVYGFGCNASADALWFNKRIFDAEGVPYPKGGMTWKAFRALAARMTRRDARGRVDRYGFLADWWNWPNFAYTFGGRPYSPDGKRSTLSSDANVRAVKVMQDLIYRDRVAPSPVDEAAMSTQGGWGSGTITYFGAGRAVMAVGGRWWLTTLRNYPGLRLGVVAMPRETTNATRGYGRATLINAQSSRRDDALRFLAFQAGREYNELVNAQADGLGPAIAYSRTSRFLNDPAHPEERDNAVWLAAVERSIPDPVSPYVSGDVALRLLSKQLDLVRANEKSPADALRTADAQIDAQMARELAENPELKARYEAAR